MWLDDFHCSASSREIRESFVSFLAHCLFSSHMRWQREKIYIGVFREWYTEDISWIIYLLLSWGYRSIRRKNQPQNCFVKQDSNMHSRKPNSALEETKCSSHSVRVCPKRTVFEGSQKLHVDESKNLQILNVYNQHEIKNCSRKCSPDFCTWARCTYTGWV